MTDISRRRFTATVAAGLLGSSVTRQSSGLASGTDADEGGIGPMVGHVSEDTANVWYRPSRPGRYTLVARAQDDQPELRATAVAEPENDLCLHWRVEGLQAATRYPYRILEGSSVVSAGEENYFTTAPRSAQPNKVCLAFGSCADTEPLALWTQMEQKGAQGIVLLGDTPYIDSRDLAVARRKHRNFLAIPELARLTRHTPLWGTWDDHDFGADASDGRLKGKENTRQAFLEYRANDTFGEDGQGIYTKFRYGPLEVFLLDTRWFAHTEPSPFDATKPTLLGRRQWDWLKEGLRTSTAMFKVIACGMIWDNKKKDAASDDWVSYAHERAALFRFLGQERISGAVLIGGDIHCSRALQYETKVEVGYNLNQFIISPIHDRTIAAYNVAHPNLLHGEAVPNVWLRLEADTTVRPARLHAKWEQINGRQMWSVHLTENDLQRS